MAVFLEYIMLHEQEADGFVEIELQKWRPCREAPRERVVPACGILKRSQGRCGQAFGKLQQA